MGETEPDYIATCSGSIVKMPGEYGELVKLSLLLLLLLLLFHHVGDGDDDEIIIIIIIIIASSSSSSFSSATVRSIPWLPVQSPIPSCLWPLHASFLFPLLRILSSTLVPSFTCSSILAVAICFGRLSLFIL